MNSRAKNTLRRSTRFVPGVALLATLLFAASSTAQQLQQGVSVQLAPTTNATPTLSAKQALRFPNVGIEDANSAFLDPPQGPDANTAQVASMIYSGLVKSDINLNVVPDQATWDVSSDNKVYTFHLKPGITFSPLSSSPARMRETLPSAR